MIVCEKCHEEDKYTTKCDRPTSAHTKIVYGFCNICGKFGVVYKCHKYTDVIKTR